MLVAITMETVDMTSKTPNFCGPCMLVHAWVMGVDRLIITCCWLDSGLYYGSYNAKQTNRGILSLINKKHGNKETAKSCETREIVYISADNWTVPNSVYNHDWIRD